MTPLEALTHLLFRLENRGHFPTKQQISMENFKNLLLS
jgi:hypothetical protein